MKDLTKYMHRDILKSLLKPEHVNGIVVVGSITKEGYHQVFFVPNAEVTVQEKNVFTVDAEDLRRYRIGGLRIEKEIPILVFDVNENGKVTDRDAIVHFQTLKLYQEGLLKAKAKAEKEGAAAALKEVEQADLEKTIVGTTDASPKKNDAPEETTEPAMPPATVDTTCPQDQVTEFADRGIDESTEEEQLNEKLPQDAPPAEEPPAEEEKPETE